MDGITATGERAALNSLEILVAELEDFTPVLERTRDLIFEWVGTAFDTGGATTAGGPWAALSPRYRAWKDAHFPGRPVLSASEALRHSLTGGENCRVEIGPDHLLIESTLMVGPWNLSGLHETGAPNAKVPARPIDLPEVTIEQIREQFEARK